MPFDFLSGLGGAQADYFHPGDYVAAAEVKPHVPLCDS
jgi:hypothetical protein